jgi:hypothetical protein
LPDKREQNPFHADDELEIMSVQASSAISSAPREHSPGGTELD